MSENDANLTTEEESSLGTVVDNSSERKLPEKIIIVNAGKPHVKFIVDEGNFPMKTSVDWVSKMKPLDEVSMFQPSS